MDTQHQQQPQQHRPDIDVYGHQELFQQIVDHSYEKQRLATQLAAKIHSNWTSSPLQILDIGSHNGSLTLKWAEHLHHPMNGDIRITCIEPNANALDSFRQKTRDLNLQFSFHQSTIEAYLEQNPSLSFDWIVASHCFYWTQNLSQCIQTLLKSGKNLVIAIQRETGIFEIRSQYPSLLRDRGFHLHSANTLREILNASKIHYYEEVAQSAYPVFPLEDGRSRLFTAFVLQSLPSEISDSMHREVWSILNRSGDQFISESSIFWISGECEASARSGKA